MKKDEKRASEESNRDERLVERSRLRGRTREMCFNFSSFLISECLGSALAARGWDIYIRVSQQLLDLLSSLLPCYHIVHLQLSQQPLRLSRTSATLSTSPVTRSLAFLLPTFQSHPRFFRPIAPCPLARFLLKSNPAQNTHHSFHYFLSFPFLTYTRRPGSSLSEPPICYS